MTQQNENGTKLLKEQNDKLQQEVIELRTKSTTNLSGAEFTFLLLSFPVILSFCVLGVCLIVMSITNSAILQNIDKLLLVFSIFSVPATGILSKMAEQISSKKDRGK